MSEEDRAPILEYGRREHGIRIHPRFLRRFLAVVGVVAGLCVVPIIFPGLFTRSRELPLEMKSVFNLRQIGLGIMQYSNDNGGKFPDSFRTLYLNEDLTSDTFVNPATNDTPAQGPTTQAIADQLAFAGHVSYAYLGKGLSTSSAARNTIVAYELVPAAGNRTAVLFGDFHVDWVAAATAAKIIAKAASGKFPVTMPSN
jgi:hypothetical protein